MSAIKTVVRKKRKKRRTLFSQMERIVSRMESQQMSLELLEGTLRDYLEQDFTAEKRMENEIARRCRSEATLDDRDRELQRLRALIETFKNGAAS